jgi:hypothetical protein
VSRPCKCRWLVSLGLSTLVLAAELPAADPISADKFQQIHRLIKPQADEEAWNEIPWQSSLWEARRKAAAEGKPILLWEMDGHPLGCT